MSKIGRTVHTKDGRVLDVRRDDSRVPHSAVVRSRGASNSTVGYWWRRTCRLGTAHGKQANFLLSQITHWLGDILPSRDIAAFVCSTYKHPVPQE